MTFVSIDDVCCHPSRRLAPCGSRLLRMRAAVGCGASANLSPHPEGPRAAKASQRMAARIHDVALIDDVSRIHDIDDGA